MTEPTDRIFHQWYVIGRNAKGRKRLHLLAWRMTQAEDQQWAAKHGKVLKVVLGTGGRSRTAIPSGGLLLPGRSPRYGDRDKDKP